MYSDPSESQIPDVFLVEVQLAQSETAEYQQTAAPQHLNAAAAAWNRILQHPNFETANLAFRISALHDGGGAYLRCYWVTGDLEYLNQAVHYLQQSLAQAPPDWSNRPGQYSNLGAALKTRYSHAGDLADLEQSIQLCELALNQTPTDSPALPSRLTNLASGISARYSLTGDRQDLERSLSLYEAAVTKTPLDDPDLPSCLSNWGAVLEARYLLTSQISDLERAIEAYSEAVQKTPPPAPDLHIYLNNLGNGLRTYYLQMGRLGILDDAIACCEQAIINTAPDSFDVPGYLTNLGNALRNRYVHTGNLEDLERAIQAYQLSVEKTPADSTYQPMFLHNWGIGLRDRYLRTGQQEDLEQSIQNIEAAVNRSALGTPELSNYLSSLGNALDDRYGRTGSLEDLERAIATHRQSVDLTPSGSSNKPSHLNNLGNALRNYHTRTRNPSDLQQAIEVYQQAVDLTPPDSSYLASRLNNLANSHRDRYASTNNLMDLEAVVATYQQAIAKTPSDSPEIVPIQNNLGNALRDLFHHTEQVADLNRAIIAYETGVQQTPPQSPELPSRQNNLATALSERFTQTGKDADLERARELFEQAAIQGLQVAPEATVLASRSWGMWATERQAWSEAVTAYRYSLQAIEQLFHTQLLRTSKETWLREVQGISACAAFAMARAGDLTGAVEALELGLARLLSEVLERDRADLERLQELGQGELCDRYRAASEQWQLLLGGAGSSTRQTDPNWTASLQNVRVMLEEAIAAIRQVPEYEDFLKPLKFNNIQAVAQECPLVYILVTEMGGLALIVNANEVAVTPLWLPDLKEAALRSQLVGVDGEPARNSYLGAYGEWSQNPQDEHCREAWFDALDSTTRWLWQVLMGSLVEVLGRVDRAVLVPVGVLGLLPLHAAWTEDPTLPTGRCYGIDRLTLTYAPNARALGAAQAIAARVVPESLLAIADPQPVSATPLENAESEAAVATSLLADYHVLRQAEATRSAVLAMLPHYSVLHCSCHGYANLMEPLASGLAMSGDEVLSLRDLLELRLVGARLAILSACETGIPGTMLPDEVISLPTGLLQAGFAGVVASLWSISDISTMMLIFRFYDLWRSRKLLPPEVLRQAQQWQRDTTNGEKVKYFNELLSRDSEQDLEKAVADRLYKSMVLTNPTRRNFAHSFHWAAFGYVGV